MCRLRHRSRPQRLDLPGFSSEPEDVGRESRPTAPDRLWVADVRRIETAAGDLYLAVVLDCYSRRCRGWWIDRRPGPDLLSRALEQVPRPLRHARVSPAGDLALALGRRCERAGVVVPPGSAATGTDAAVAETFFAMLRRDLLGSHARLTRSDGAAAIAAWIAETYNPYGTAPTEVAI
jgi:putative transposase